MCQMCDEYEAELRRMGMAMDETVMVQLGRDDYEELSRLATEHGRTVADEVRTIVRRSLRPLRDGKIDFVEWSRRIRAMTPTDVPQTDSLTLLREDRDR